MPVNPAPRHLASIQLALVHDFNELLETSSRVGNVELEAGEKTVRITSQYGKHDGWKALQLKWNKEAYFHWKFRGPWSEPFFLPLY
jgi:hypothetical protein